MRDMDVPSQVSPLALAAALLGVVGLRWAFGQAIPAPAAAEPPALLPANIGAGRKDVELGTLQRSYRRLLQLGLHEEAAELAEKLGNREPVLTPPREVPVVTPAVRTVVRKPVPATDVSFPSRGDARWVDCRRQPVSFRFAGASADDVARFLHDTTGLGVRVLPGATPAAGFHGEVRGKPLGEALALIGAEVRPVGAGVAFVPVAPLALRMAGEPLRR